MHLSHQRQPCGGALQLLGDPSKHQSWTSVLTEQPAFKSDINYAPSQGSVLFMGLKQVRQMQPGPLSICCSISEALQVSKYEP